MDLQKEANQTSEDEKVAGIKSPINNLHSKLDTNEERTVY